MALEFVTGPTGYKLWLEYVERPTGHTVSTVGYRWLSSTNTHETSSSIKLEGTAGTTTYASLTGLDVNLAGSPEALDPNGNYLWCSVIRIIDIASGLVLGMDTTPGITHVPYTRYTPETGIVNWYDGHQNTTSSRMDKVYGSFAANNTAACNADWVSTWGNGTTYKDLPLALYDPVSNSLTGMHDGLPVGYEGISFEFAYMKGYRSVPISYPYGGTYSPPFGFGIGLNDPATDNLTVDVMGFYDRLTVNLYPYGPPQERSVAVEFPFDVAIRGVDTVSPGDGTYSGPPRTDDPQLTPGGKVVRRPPSDGDSDNSTVLSLENDEAETELTEPVTVDILANDYIPDGVAGVYLHTEPDPAEGTATLEEVDGRWIVTFTAAEGFTGLSKFRYKVEDVNGVTARATIRIMVNAPGDPPTYWIDETDGSLVIIKDKNRVYYLAAGQVILTYLLSPTAMSLLASSGFYLRYASDDPGATVPDDWTFEAPVLGGQSYLLNAFETTDPLYLTTGLRRYSYNRSGVAVLVKDGVVTFDSMPSEDDIRAADEYYPGGRDAIISRNTAQLIVNEGKPLDWLTPHVE